jgi:hypothetical protein
MLGILQQSDMSVQRWKSPTQATLCGGGRKCTQLGDCCSWSGVCGSGPAFCMQQTAYDAAPDVTCYPKVMPYGQLPACDKASAPIRQARGLRCGPANNAICPWTKGLVDLCCVPDHMASDPGDGRCVPCHEVPKGTQPLEWGPKS